MYFIAEIGINHNGNLDMAKDLIREAAESDCNCVKFQKRTPEICVPKDQWNKPRNWLGEDMTYIEYKNRIEFGKAEYDEIDALCNELGIDWTASPWDIDSLDFIMRYDIPFIKVASASVTDIALLEAIGRTKKPVVMSTGMSTLEEVKAALDVLGDYIDYEDITLLICNSSYPSVDEEIDLTSMVHLVDKVGRNIYTGYSGHESDTLPTIIAASMYAHIIERHITLDKTLDGTDHSASLDCVELHELMEQLRRIKVIQGSLDLHVYPSEEIVKTKLRRV